MMVERELRRPMFAVAFLRDDRGNLSADLLTSQVGQATFSAHGQTASREPPAGRASLPEHGNAASAPWRVPAGFPGTATGDQNRADRVCAGVGETLLLLRRPPAIYLKIATTECVP